MKNKTLLRIVTTVFCIAVLCCISFFLGGAAQNPDVEETKSTVIVKEFDWTMNASVLNTGGEVLKTFPLTIDGPIVKVGEAIHLDFLIHVPDAAAPEIGWKYEALDEGYKRPMPWMLESKDYVWFDYCFNYIFSKYEHVLFALSVEKEYLIAYWNDGEEYMLVASTDSNATVDEIREYFSYFIDKYATSFSNQQA